jgi:signal transduction histidine kinase/DNA-binding response OmpR family regulator
MGLSIKAKLSLLSVFSLIILASSISYVAIERSSSALLESKFAQLSTIEVVKHGELNSYFTRLKQLITTMASNQAKLESYKKLLNGFHNLYKDLPLDIEDIKEKIVMDYNINYLNLVNYNVPNSHQREETLNYLPSNINGLIAQYAFITDNRAPVGQKDSLSFNKKYKSFYMDIHKEAHNSYDRYLKSFNIYDIFLIDLEGNIIYTVLKEKDFATNLNTDMYQDSSLAKVYYKALKLTTKQVVFEDFKPYEPSYNLPAAFIATPIFEKGKKIGVLAFQLPVDNFNSIMQFGGEYERAGLGKSGECYLVGSDYLMRTNSRFQKDIADSVIEDLGTTVGIWEIRTESIEAVFNGDNNIGKKIISGYKGKDVLNVYHAIDIFDTTKWAIIAEIDKNEALKPANDLKNYLLYTTLILLVISLFLTIMALRSTIFKRLNYFQKELIHFFEFLKTGKGDIKTLVINSNDEIAKMSKFINNGIMDVKHVLHEREDQNWIKDGMGQLNSIFIDNSSLNDVTEQCLQFLMEYLEANVGIIYLYDKETQQLVQNNTYAFTNQEQAILRYKIGEGVVGQVALQQKPIILSDSLKKDTDLIIHTATSIKKPLATYTFPLVYQKELYGVIELGSFKKFLEKKINFLTSATRVVATAISNAMKNQKVNELLFETEKSNRQLKDQKKSLKDANIAMEEQQQQLEVANTNLEEQQQQLEEANALMEEQQQQLELKNHDLEKVKEELIKRAEELELSNKYKSEFLANMSHELRTPLNAIILLSQLLSKNKQKHLDNDDIKKAQTIYTSGNELLRLINDILDLSKVEAGKIEVIIDKFDPNELLENIKDLYSFSADEKGIELKVVNNYKEIISSDQNRISQILKNLVSNALKFTHEGNITITIDKIKDKIKPIKITVSDTGIGIPQDKQKLIFEAFTQADGSTSREYGGTGLGLSITKELTYLLGGEISLESSENVGSQFIIKLPNLDESNIPKRHLEKEILSKPLKIETPLKVTSRVRDDRDIIGGETALLIIDDDSSFSEIVYETIKKSGYYGLVANTGQEGLALFDQYKISGIMLDLTLPDMDGIDILKSIKSDKKLQDIPVYIISSKDRDEKLIKLGAKGYGQKPLLEDDIEEIISTLDKFIEDHHDIKKEQEDETFILDEIDLEGINVLVVDDDIKNIFVLDNILNESNARVFTAYNGAEAIEQLKENKEINIVLMDIMMPVMDGYEAIKAIRADEKLKTIPIIAVTAKVMKEDKDKCIALGADDFVSKPIDMDALVSLVKVWGDKKHQ